MKLYHDVPRPQGVANTIKRARQATEIQWCPRVHMPASNGLYLLTEENGIDRKSFHSYHCAWRPQYGLPYSSCRASERFIGYNVSVETFMPALMNPHSVLYTKNLHGTGISAAGDHWACVIARNEYGCYVSNHVPLKVTE